MTLLWSESCLLTNQGTLIPYMHNQRPGSELFRQNVFLLLDPPQSQVIEMSGLTRTCCPELLQVNALTENFGASVSSTLPNPINCYNQGYTLIGYCQEMKTGMFILQPWGKPSKTRMLRNLQSTHPWAVPYIGSTNQVLKMELFRDLKVGGMIIQVCVKNLKCMGDPAEEMELYFQEVPLK